MIPRYSDPRVTEACSLAAKYNAWQVTELAVIKAREILHMISAGTWARIHTCLMANPIDCAKIDQYEVELRHDLNAFVKERLYHLPPDLQPHFHSGMTSYDTEEPAFVILLKSLCAYIVQDIEALQQSIRKIAIEYRHVPMNARTHGQEAEMQSFGKRCLTWWRDLEVALKALHTLRSNLEYSKLSGAIGTNSTISPQLEGVALANLDLKPWTGATQIMPRVTYSSIANTIADIAAVCDKIAGDIRLMARSGRPLCHEPFGKKQMGSSAMPHKKNTILTENVAGMARLARVYALGLSLNIQTWEERSIEQSSVERVLWPDLTHVTLNAMKNLRKVIDGLVVYPDNMLVEIVGSRGCYASNEAKEVLAELGGSVGITKEEAYRIVQLAAFNAMQPSGDIQILRNHPAQSLEAADLVLLNMQRVLYDRTRGNDRKESIQTIILDGKLAPHPSLDASQEQVSAWNDMLNAIFGSQEGTEACRTWNTVFNPSHILANEAHLFQEVFGV